MKISLLSYGLNGLPFTLGYAALAKGLLANGIKEIDLAYLDKPTDMDVHSMFPAAVRFVRLGSPRSRWSPFAIANYLKEHKPDICISMPIHLNVPAIIGWRMVNGPRPKLIVSERALLSHKVYIQHPHSIVWRLMPMLARTLYPRASGVVCNSSDVAQDLIHNIGVKIASSELKVIVPAIDLDSARSDVDIPPAHPWFHDDGPPIIINVARLSPEKNLTCLINSFAQLRHLVDCRLLILGEGMARAELQSLVQGLGLEHVVSMPGIVENPWVYMAHATVFVMTSKEEAFGRVLVEAMASGTPVIAADAIGGGPRTILDGGRYGILLPNDNPEELVKAMAQVITDSQYRSQLRKLGHERALISEPKTIAKSWLDFASTL